MNFGSESVNLNIWWDEEGWSTSFTEVDFMPIRCVYNALVGIVLTPRVGSSSTFTSGTSKPQTFLRAGYSNVSDPDNDGPASRKSSSISKVFLARLLVLNDGYETFHNRYVRRGVD